MSALPELLAGAAGLRWTEHLHGLARARLHELAGAHGGMESLLRVAAVRPDVAEQVAATFTVGETWFQRIGAQLEALPDLLADRRHVRAWSAGCSTGEEAYALAAAFTRQTVEVLGTDLNPESLRRARRGTYGAWSFRGVPAGQVERFFESRGEQFEVRPELRRWVRFAVHNLLNPAPLRDLDVIACRNVTIYFTPAAAAQVYTNLALALAPGGVLLTAPSDPRPPAHLGLVVERCRGTQVLRRPVRPAPLPAVRPAPGHLTPVQPSQGHRPQGQSYGLRLNGLQSHSIRAERAGEKRFPDVELTDRWCPDLLTKQTESVSYGRPPELQSVPAALRAAPAPAGPDLPAARRGAYEAPLDPQAQLELARALRADGQSLRAARQAQHALSLLESADPDRWLTARLRAECLSLLAGAGEP